MYFIFFITIRLFAETAHHFNEPLDIDAVKLSKLAKCNINLNDVGVWIDPIGKVMTDAC